MLRTPACVVAQFQKPATSKPGIVRRVPLPMPWPTGTLSQNSTLIWLRPFAIELGKARVTVDVSL